MNQGISLSPDGIKYPLPKKEDYEKELNRAQKLVKKAKRKGQGNCCCHGSWFCWRCNGGHCSGYC